MIRIDQIKILEDRVNKAVELIKTLREENKTLRAGLDSAQKKIDELEGLIDTFKTEQGEIEEGILRALESLDKIEDEIIVTPENSKSAESANSTANDDIEVLKEDNNPKAEENSELDIF